MNVFAPHGAVLAHPPCMHRMADPPHPHPHPYYLYLSNHLPTTPTCPRCSATCADLARAPNPIFPSTATCPCQYQQGNAAPLTVNVNGPVLSPILTCGGPPHAHVHSQLPPHPQNRLYINPNVMARPTCTATWNGSPPFRIFEHRAPTCCGPSNHL